MIAIAREDDAPEPPRPAFHAPETPRPAREKASVAQVRLWARRARLAWRRQRREMTTEAGYREAQERGLAAYEARCGAGKKGAN